jgi:hypothetical protein
VVVIVLEELLVFIHKLSAILWIGAVIGELLWAGQGKLSRGVSEVEVVFEDLIQKMKVVELAARITGGIIIITGILLVLSKGYDFTGWWIVVKFLAIIAAIAINILFNSKVYKEIEKIPPDSPEMKIQFGLIGRNSCIILAAAAFALIATSLKF